MCLIETIRQKVILHTCNCLNKQVWKLKSCTWAAGYADSDSLFPPPDCGQTQDDQSTHACCRNPRSRSAGPLTDPESKRTLGVSMEISFLLHCENYLLFQYLKYFTITMQVINNDSIFFSGK